MGIVHNPNHIVRVGLTDQIYSEVKKIVNHPTSAKFEDSLMELLDRYKKLISGEDAQK